MTIPHGVCVICKRSIFAPGTPPRWRHHNWMMDAQHAAKPVRERTIKKPKIEWDQPKLWDDE